MALVQATVLSVSTPLPAFSPRTSSSASASTSASPSSSTILISSNSHKFITFNSVSLLPFDVGEDRALAPPFVLFTPQAHLIAHRANEKHWHPASYPAPPRHAGTRSRHGGNGLQSHRNNHIMWHSQGTRAHTGCNSRASMVSSSSSFTRSSSSALFGSASGGMIANRYLQQGSTCSNHNHVLVTIRHHRPMTASEGVLPAV